MTCRRFEHDPSQCQVDVTKGRKGDMLSRLYQLLAVGRRTNDLHDLSQCQVDVTEGWKGDMLSRLYQPLSQWQWRGD